MKNGEYVTDAVHLDEDEEAIVDKFLNPSGAAFGGMFGGGPRNLADIILSKIREKEAMQLGGGENDGEAGDETNLSPKVFPPHRLCVDTYRVLLMMISL